ncbi:putative nuclease HARBI1 [Lucilia cuprina]|nr:putative nuclease HARBI1 [Lucilia cuprina]
MNSIIMRVLVEEIDVVVEEEHRTPLELPQSLFQKYYRVNKPAFRYLLEILTRHSQPLKKQFRIAPIIKLSASLRFFAEGGYQTGVGKDSDVSIAQSTFCKVLAEVINIFETHLCPIWIKVPTTEEKRIAIAFYSKYNIPGVVGCIDGTHVQIIAPSDNKHLFYNRKRKFSMNVLLLCDHQLNIRYVDSSHPGACHDSLIWNTSDLRTHFEQKYLQGETNFWLLGKINNS